MICVYFGVCFQTSGPPEIQVFFDKCRSLSTNILVFSDTCDLCLFRCVFSDDLSSQHTGLF